VALTPATETEVVALVTALDSLDVLDGVDLVVPALDTKSTEARVRELLVDPSVVRVESIHDYLRLGHDRAVLVSDDPSARGRSMAALLSPAGQSLADRGQAVTSPSEVVAWLASAWTPSVPESLRDDVIQPIAIARQLVATLADPAAGRFVEQHVATGEIAVEILPKTGDLAVRMARSTGPRGHVLVIVDETDADRLRDYLALNSVNAWTDLVIMHEPSDAQNALSKFDRVDLLCIAGHDLDTTAVEAASEAVLERRVRRLLVRIAPASLRHEPDAVRELFVQLRADMGAAFATVSWDGQAIATPLDELLCVDESVLVAVDVIRPS